MMKCSFVWISCTVPVGVAQPVPVPNDSTHNSVVRERKQATPMPGSLGDKSRQRGYISLIGGLLSWTWVQRGTVVLCVEVYCGGVVGIVRTWRLWSEEGREGRLPRVWECHGTERCCWWVAVIGNGSVEV